eukprot:15440538-Alexandrium_andersonii.AAC.1
MGEQGSVSCQNGVLRTQDAQPGESPLQCALPIPAVLVLLAAPCLGLGDRPLAAVAKWYKRWCHWKRKTSAPSEYPPGSYAGEQVGQEPAGAAAGCDLAGGSNHPSPMSDAGAPSGYAVPNLRRGAPAVRQSEMLK